MRCSNGIEVTDAQPHSQLLVQFCLQLAACNQRGRLTPHLQPVEDGGKHFGWVSMSAILEGGFSWRASLLPPTVGGGPTRVDPSSCCRLLPGHPCFHEFEHMLFGCSSLLLFHARSMFALLSGFFLLPPVSYLILVS